MPFKERRAANKIEMLEKNISLCGSVKKQTMNFWFSLANLASQLLGPLRTSAE